MIIIHALSNAKKIRLISDLKVFLIRELYRQSLGDKYDELFKGWNTHGPRHDPMSRFIYLLEMKNNNCFYWYQEMYLKGIDESVWETLLNLAKHNTTLVRVIQALRSLQSQLSKNHKEKYLYTMCAIAMILFENRIEWTSEASEASEASEGLMSDQEAEQLFQDHLSTWTPDNLPYGKVG